jgi:membrane protein DedA with SNARE-associated domain
MSDSVDWPAFITLLAGAGPVGIAGIALAEKLVPVLPSYVVFVLLGMIAASGPGDLAVTVAASATGSTLGAFGWYGLGLALGQQRIERLIGRFGPFVCLKPVLYRRMADAYTRNHFWVTLVGQTIPAVRVYLSIPAGVLQLAILNFLGATLIGSLIWSGPLLTLGYVLRERSADAAFAGLLLVTALVGVEFLALLGWQLARRSKGSGQNQQGADDQEAGRDRHAAAPADAKLQGVRLGIHAERVEQPRQQQRGHQQVDAERRNT